MEEDKVKKMEEDKDVISISDIEKTVENVITDVIEEEKETQEKIKEEEEKENEEKQASITEILDISLENQETSNQLIEVFEKNHAETMMLQKKIHEENEEMYLELIDHSLLFVGLIIGAICAILFIKGLDPL